MKSLLCLTLLGPCFGHCIGGLCERKGRGLIRKVKAQRSNAIWVDFSQPLPGVISEMEGESFWNQHPEHVKKRLQSLAPELFQTVIRHSPEVYLNITSATLYSHAATVISDAAVILPVCPHAIPSHHQLIGWDVWSERNDLEWERILQKFEMIPSGPLTLPEMVYHTHRKSLYVISIQAFSWMVTGTYVNAPEKVSFNARFPMLLNAKHPYGQVTATDLCQPELESLLVIILKSSSSWTPAKAIAKCLEL